MEKKETRRQVKTSGAEQQAAGETDDLMAGWGSPAPAAATRKAAAPVGGLSAPINGGGVASDRDALLGKRPEKRRQGTTDRAELDALQAAERAAGAGAAAASKLEDQGEQITGVQGSGKSTRQFPWHLDPHGCL